MDRGAVVGRASGDPSPIFIEDNMINTIIVTGSRNWFDKEKIRMVLEDLAPKRVYQGGCNGADNLARQVCAELKIHCLTIPADWTHHGQRGGPIRNEYMLREAKRFGLDMVVAFHDDIERSKGTKHMIGIARREGVRVMVVTGGG